MKCWVCGKEEAEYSYTTSDFYYYHEAKSDIVLKREAIKEKHRDAGEETSPRMFCRECFMQRAKDLERARTEYAKLKKKLMLERAVRILEKQALDIYQYKDIIEDFGKYVEEKPDKFDSSHEMIAAMILVDNGIKAKMQHKVGNYRADFYIEDLKIILEIDGDLHANNLYRDNQRDIKMREILGDEWEIVRIGTKYLEQNATALIDAMIGVRNEKKKIRAKHHGYLPDWYSSRNKAQRTRSIKGADEHLFDFE